MLAHDVKATCITHGGRLGDDIRDTDYQTEDGGAHGCIIYRDFETSIKKKKKKKKKRERKEEKRKKPDHKPAENCRESVNCNNNHKSSSSNNNNIQCEAGVKNEEAWK